MANAAIYIASLVLVSCGYFIGLKKSILIPSQSIPYLGFISDSLKQAFILPDGKKEKFTFLRESLINSNFVSIKSLQRFAGKAVSFSLAIPVAKLFCREINSHIGKGLTSSKPLRMTRSLKDELSSWRFLDTWHGFLPWGDEKHFSGEVTTDTSNSDWAGILSSPEGSKNTRDYWSNEVVEGTDIAIKEARALYNTLATFGSEVFNGRVTAFVDNSNLISFWNKEGGKSIALSNEIKDLFSLSVNLNISLRMTYVPSDSNSADSPSRFYSDLDCTLSQVTWSQVESQFGPHSFDLMATQSNVMKDASGRDLRFFSPLPMQGSSGVNIFSQDLSPYENYYVFLPFVLIGSLLRFFQAKYLRVTFIARDVFPRKYWWPTLNAICVDRIQIGKKNETGVLNFHPTSKSGWHSKPLPWDLYAYRILF